MGSGVGAQRPRFCGEWLGDGWTLAGWAGGGPGCLRTERVGHCVAWLRQGGVLAVSGQNHSR